MHTFPPSVAAKPMPGSAPSSHRRSRYIVSCSVIARQCCDGSATDPPKQPHADVPARVTLRSDSSPCSVRSPAMRRRKPVVRCRFQYGDPRKLGSHHGAHGQQARATRSTARPGGIHRRRVALFVGLRSGEARYRRWLRPVGRHARQRQLRIDRRTRGGHAVLCAVRFRAAAWLLPFGPHRHRDARGRQALAASGLPRDARRAAVLAAVPLRTLPASRGGTAQPVGLARHVRRLPPAAGVRPVSARRRGGRLAVRVSPGTRHV
jgi:hypothetical protein